jgi:hypothetical protein
LWLLIAIKGLRVKKAVLRIGCSRNQFTKDIAAELSMLSPELREIDPQISQMIADQRDQQTHVFSSAHICGICGSVLPDCSISNRGAVMSDLHRQDIGYTLPRILPQNSYGVLRIKRNRSADFSDNRRFKRPELLNYLKATGLG